MSSPELESAEAAAILFRKGEGDAKAVRKVSADPEMDDEIIGFHAQQAVEKWLKAVVANRGEDFEHTHDLHRLISLANLDSGESLDREAALKLIEEVRRWAETALASEEWRRYRLIRDAARDPDELLAEGIALSVQAAKLAAVGR